MSHTTLFLLKATTFDGTNPAVCIHLSACLLYIEIPYFNSLDYYVESCLA
jgi:hypothetical protein